MKKWYEIEIDATRDLSKAIEQIRESVKIDVLEDVLNTAKIYADGVPEAERWRWAGLISSIENQIDCCKQVAEIGLRAFLDQHRKAEAAIKEPVECVAS